MPKESFYEIIRKIYLILLFWVCMLWLGLLASSLQAQSLGSGPYSGISSAISADGVTYTWGTNYNGQLGNGTNTDANVPQNISSKGALAGKKVISVAAGQVHTLALASDGTVYAWGNGSLGQLGNGTSESSNVPVQVLGLDGVKEIAAGSAHSLAIGADGQVYAWGYNAYGQLGNGTTTNSLVPVLVTGLTGVKAISTGADHSLALDEDGNVYTWGRGSEGQASNSPVPVQLAGISGAKAITAGGYHSMIIGADDMIYAWGRNNNGQLGNGSTNTTLTPVRVVDLSKAIAISGGYEHSLAVGADGQVYAWGYNAYGQLGNGTTTNSLVPVQVHEISEVKAIMAGGAHSLAIGLDDNVYAWGYGLDGKLGHGMNTNSAVPVKVQGMLPLIATCHSTTGGAALSYNHYIRNVTFAGINNTTGLSSGPAFYSDYTAVTTGKVSREGTYSFTVSGSVPGLPFAVWVDWNNNGSFADAGEFVLQRKGELENPTFGSIEVPANAYIGKVRMRVMSNASSNYPLTSDDYCAENLFGSETEDYTLIVTNCSAEQSYVSSEAAQPNTKKVAKDSPNNPILRVQVESLGACPSNAVIKFNLSTEGTDNPASSITAAKIYYTGTSPDFATHTLFGEVNAPVGNFSISGERKLSSGVNYFWLAYDVGDVAIIGNKLDAKVISLVGSGSIGTVEPSNPSPTGYRLVDYCRPDAGGAAQPYSQYITNVTFAGINNNSGLSDPLEGVYADFTNTPPASVQAGGTYEITITKTDRLSGGPNSFAVWIDWNNNGTFADAGEFAFNVPASNITAATGTITVPQTATTGDHRMRVISNIQGSFTADDYCGSFYGAEIEDYTVRLKLTPVITWDNPAGIAEGTALSSVQLNATANVPGTFTYSPAAGTILPAGNNQTLSVDFIPNDTETYASIIGKTVSITVNGKPILTVSGATTLNELQTLNLSSSSSDPNQDIVTYSLMGTVPTGMTINNSTGAVTWTPTEAQGPGSYTFTVKATDNGSPALSDEKQIAVTVNEVNVAPVLAAIGAKSVPVDLNLQFSVSATDSDIPAQSLVYAAAPLPAGATFNVATRTFSWTPKGNQVGEYNVTFSVSDGSLTTQEVVKITVTKPAEQKPAISSFSPTSGTVGSSVTITGSNFTGVTAVAFNGVSAAFNLQSGASIIATVPAGATTGKISVTNSAGTATSKQNFTVTTSNPAPTISGFTPSSGSAGTSVSITGTNFTGATSVAFNGTVAAFTVISATSIQTQVPLGATSGKISVTAPGGTATSKSNFKVTATSTASALRDINYERTLIAFPNPFDESAKITFSLEKEEDFVLEVFDMRGAMMKKLAAGTAEANRRYQFEFRGEGLSEGLYITRLTTTSSVRSVKVVLKR